MTIKGQVFTTVAGMNCQNPNAQQVIRALIDESLGAEHDFKSVTYHMPYLLCALHCMLLCSSCSFVFNCT